MGRWCTVPLVLRKPTFWIILTLHIILLNYHRYVAPLAPLDFTVVVGLPASLLIFLVVFYNGNCYNRFYELWSLTTELVVMVHEWVVQTSFIYDEMDKVKIDATVVTTNKWRAARRVLASLHLLFMALDAEVDSSDALGRTLRLPNHLDGDGVDDDEYTVMLRLNLLTPSEVDEIRRFHGLKSLVPIKWALAELRADCKPEDRMTNQAKNYEALQDIAINFNKRSMLIVMLLQQPVPYVYFHVLKLMMLIVNSLIAYSLVDLFEDSMLLSVTTFSVICIMLLGLQEIAGAMADPFGDDVTDFDTRKVCRDAYNNALSYLMLEHTPAVRNDSGNVYNPLPSILPPPSAKTGAPPAAAPVQAASEEVQHSRYSMLSSMEEDEWPAGATPQKQLQA